MKQFIICPNCGAIELATIEETIPFWTYIHDCTKCKFTIMESDWAPAKAISIRQPWSFFIMHGFKHIENRTWKLPEKYKGERVLLHTGCMQAHDWVDKVKSIPGAWDQLSDNCFDYRYSAIIGSVEIVDCVLNHPSIWAEHTAAKKIQVAGETFDVEVPVYNWVLKDPILFENPILNVKGKLSFFTPEIPSNHVD